MVLELENTYFLPCSELLQEQILANICCLHAHPHYEVETFFRLRL